MDTDNILNLIKEISNSSITKFKYSDSEFSLELETNKANEKIVEKTHVIEAVNSDTSSISQEEMVECVDEDCEIIESNLVGTFYAASKEGGEPFVSVGDTIKKGQVVGIIEAMKLMNEIESPYEGTVLEILVKNNEVIGYSQPLIKIKK